MHTYYIAIINLHNTLAKFQFFLVKDMLVIYGFGPPEVIDLSSKNRTCTIPAIPSIPTLFTGLSLSTTKGNLVLCGGELGNFSKCFVLKNSTWHVLSEEVSSMFHKSIQDDEDSFYLTGKSNHNIIYLTTTY